MLPFDSPSVVISSTGVTPAFSQQPVRPRVQNTRRHPIVLCINNPVLSALNYRFLTAKPFQNLAISSLLSTSRPAPYPESCICPVPFMSADTILLIVPAVFLSFPGQIYRSLPGHAPIGNPQGLYGFFSRQYRPVSPH